MAFHIERGANISHWLSQSAARGEERRKRFTRDDARRLADLGLDHLRLPVDEEQLWTDDGAVDAEAADLLRQGLDWCEENGLRAVVDLHILRCHHFNSDASGKTLFTDPAAPERFAALWRDLSKMLGDRSVDRVAYELMNEPVADDPADWNRVLRAPYEAIREREPDRVIGVGSNRWCQTATFPDFDPPAGDPNIILVCHYYTPMPITHYNAPWVAGMRDYDGPVRYPGRPVPEEELEKLPPDVRVIVEQMNAPFGRDVMVSDFAVALAKAKEMSLPLWCNEFGVIARAPEDVRVAWYRDMRSVLEELGIPWTNWDFRGGFGLFDGENRPTVVVDALLG